MKQGKLSNANEKLLMKVKVLAKEQKKHFNWSKTSSKDLSGIYSQLLQGSKNGQTTTTTK